MITLQVNSEDENQNRVALMAMQLAGIPQEKINAMADYARDLRKQFPHFKPERIKNKVAAKFKVKLV